MPATGAPEAAVLKLEHLTELQFRALADSAAIEVDGQSTTKRAFLDQLAQQQAAAAAERRARIGEVQTRFAAKRAQFLAREKAGLDARTARVRAELTRLRQTTNTTAPDAVSTPVLDASRSGGSGTLDMPPPRIDDIEGGIQPGAEILITGSGFGGAVGTASLILRNPVFGDKVLPITPAEWKDTYVYGTIPDVTGTPDGLGTIQVVTRDGSASNLIAVSFRARHEWIKLPGKDVDGDCSRTSAKDFCQGKGDRITECWGPGIKFPGLSEDSDPASFYAEHASRVCTSCSGGTDRFGATLKNGWTFADMGWWWTTHSTSLGSGSVEEPRGFVAGSTGTSIEVTWKTGYCSWVQYGVNLYITGPAGVPYK